MLKIRSTLFGVDHGEVALFDHFDAETEMWTGDGVREVQQPVAFSEPFEQVPVVQVAVSLMDADTDAFLRLRVGAREITRQGFTARCEVWGDTRIARLMLTWQATGALDDPEEYWRL
ncbi:MAG: H-type lectin domain-containing protein [Pseudomonadota bacterium]